MQIKTVIIDNIHYINFIAFNISTLFFLDLPRWDWRASYMPPNTVIVYFNTLSHSWFENKLVDSYFDMHTQNKVLTITNRKPATTIDMP